MDVNIPMSLWRMNQGELQRLDAGREGGGVEGKETGGKRDRSKEKEKRPQTRQHSSAKDKLSLSLILSFIQALIYSYCRASGVPAAIVHHTAHIADHLLTGNPEFLQLGSRAA